MIWFTSDQHYGHNNILKYCNRPFSTVWEMDSELMRRHNEVVSPKDTVYIIGDFTLDNHDFAVSIMETLNGNLVFLPGSHDGRWFDRNLGDGRIRCVDPIHILEKVTSVPIVLCHYAMRVWSRSHYGSWHLFGHSHGNLEPHGLSFDIGVDSHNFYPWSLDEISEKMATLKPIVNYSKGDKV